MKLGTLRNDTRDGALCVVSRDLKVGAIAFDIAPTLQAALDDWDYASPRLEALYDALNRDAAPSSAFDIDFTRFQAPLPRAYQWIDGGGYASHAERLKLGRGARNSTDDDAEPQMCWLGSDALIGANDSIVAASEEWGIDPAGKLGVITGDVPMGVRHDKVGGYVRLLTLLNDVCLRNFELTGVDSASVALQSKISAAFAPVAVTSDELGDAWDGRKVKLALVVRVNEDTLGQPNAGTDMSFNFPRLISHAARTRSLGAGTIISAGTVSNKDLSVGFASIAEKRAIEIINHGTAMTPFLRFGDRVRLEMLDLHGGSIFGPIDQTVVPQVDGR